MIWAKNKVVVLVLTIFTGFASGFEYEEAIRELCRLRVGSFPHPNPSFCGLYVQCQLVNGVVNECEDGTIFVVNEGCVSGNRETCERDEPPPRDNVCDGIDLGIFPNPGSCTSYILCVFGEPEITQCPTGAPVFNENKSSCTEGDPETCEIFIPTTPEPTTTSTTTTETTTTETTTQSTTIASTTTTVNTPSTPSSTTPRPNPPPRNVCRRFDWGFKADPESCYRYYLCLGRFAQLRKCSQGHIFSKRLNICIRGNQETCERQRFF